MGVKSTVTLTREEAEARFWAALEALATRDADNDRNLERMLELMNDELHGGEGFENYRIIPTPPRQSGSV